VVHTLLLSPFLLMLLIPQVPFLLTPFFVGTHDLVALRNPRMAKQPLPARMCNNGTNGKGSAQNDIVCERTGGGSFRGTGEHSPEGLRGWLIVWPRVPSCPSALEIPGSLPGPPARNSANRQYHTLACPEMAWSGSSSCPNHPLRA
jgi:hypothetical protein